MKLEFDQRLFYQVGIVAFGMVAIMNTATILQIYNTLLITELISQIFSNIFNYALFGFFFYLYKQLPPKYDPVTDKEMEDILKLAEKKK